MKKGVLRENEMNKNERKLRKKGKEKERTPVATLVKLLHPHHMLAVSLLVWF
jgi:hypothetical protein